MKHNIRNKSCPKWQLSGSCWPDNERYRGQDVVFEAGIERRNLSAGFHSRHSMFTESYSLLAAFPRCHLPARVRRARESPSVFFESQARIAGKSSRCHKRVQWIERREKEKWLRLPKRSRFVRIRLKIDGSRSCNWEIVVCSE